MKRKFKFYSRSDKKQETVGIIEARNYNEAVVMAAEMKKLTIDSFIEIFEIQGI